MTIIQLYSNIIVYNHNNMVNPTINHSLIGVYPTINLIMQHPVSDGTTTPFKSISNVNFGFQSNVITCHEKDQQIRSHEAFRSNPGNPAATCSIWAWRPLWPCMSSSCERNLRICLKEPGPSKYPWEMLFYPQMFSLVGGFNHLEKHESQLGLLFPIYGKS